MHGNNANKSNTDVFHPASTVSNASSNLADSASGNPPLAQNRRAPELLF
jgi:hypothetical protein